MEALLTTEQIAEWLQVDVVTVRRLVDRGELAAYRVGGEYRFEKKDILEYLARVRVENPRRLAGGRLGQEITARLRRDDPNPSAGGRFDRFTDRARGALTFAQEEAQRLHHSYIGTEHLLLGILRESEGVGARALSSMGVGLEGVSSEVESAVGRGDRVVTGEIGLTPRVKKALEMAVDEAHHLGHHYVGTEHLLLGILREREGLAAGILGKLGVEPEAARQEIARILREQSGS